MHTILITGFPGFLGSELLPRVLARSDENVAMCLVQTKFADLAKLKLEGIESAHPAIAGRTKLLTGDITRPGLDLDPQIAADVREIYHLAAVYDLSVPREIGMAVNVHGTQNVADFALRCANLERFHYVSTCYVSGRHFGFFFEHDLVKGQQFNNFYEETKYLAELEVQERMTRENLPTTIYRPAVVVGDSRTGVTQKFDGPYPLIRWLLRQPKFAFLPVVGDRDANRFNVVPSDFVIEAISYLSAHPQSLGKVYQLADPEPLTINETLAVIERAVDRRVLRIPLPLRVAKGAIEHVPGVYRLMQIPSSSVDYFVHPTHYVTTNASKDLADSGITVPRLADYIDRLVAFLRAHPEITSAAMA